MKRIIAFFNKHISKLKAIGAALLFVAAIIGGIAGLLQVVQLVAGVNPPQIIVIIPTPSTSQINTITPASTITLTYFPNDVSTKTPFSTPSITNSLIPVPTATPLGKPTLTSPPSSGLVITQAGKNFLSGIVVDSKYCNSKYQILVYASNGNQHQEWDIQSPSSSGILLSNGCLWSANTGDWDAYAVYLVDADLDLTDLLSIPTTGGCPKKKIEGTIYDDICSI